MLCPRQGSLPNREDCRFLVLSQGFRYPGGGIEKESCLRYDGTVKIPMREQVRERFK
jgi:hypothetical protein